jgi:hypothetical protein
MVAGEKDVRGESTAMCRGRAGERSGRAMMKRGCRGMVSNTATGLTTRPAVSGRQGVGNQTWAMLRRRLEATAQPQKD